MLVIQSPKGVEYYDSAKDFLREETRIEVDIQIVGMDKMLRIAALTFGQMEKINKTSRDRDGNLDSIEFTINTIIEGVVRPRFSREDALQLVEYNGEIVRELSNQIWQLGRITKKSFEAYVELNNAKPNQPTV